MMIRTVPDGDERDKDVANAIRYAVDNGAQIINMSFGKGFSPYKAAVDEAVKYADAKGVLMVHAAGNDGADLGREAELPDAGYMGGGQSGELDRGRRVVVEGRRQSRRAVLELRQGAGRRVRARRGHPARRCRATSTSATAARAWPRRSSAGLAALIMAYYPEPLRRPT